MVVSDQEWNETGVDTVEKESFVDTGDQESYVDTGEEDQDTDQKTGSKKR